MTGVRSESAGPELPLTGRPVMLREFVANGYIVLNTSTPRRARTHSVFCEVRRARASEWAALGKDPAVCR